MDLDEWRCPVCEKRDVHLEELRSDRRSQAGLLLKWFRRSNG